MCRLIFHSEKPWGLSVYPHSHACQHTFSPGGAPPPLLGKAWVWEVFPHVFRCWHLKGWGWALRILSQLCISWAAPWTGISAWQLCGCLVHGCPPWMPWYLCDGVYLNAILEPIRHLPRQVNLATETCAVCIKACWSFLHITWWCHSCQIQAAPRIVLGGLRVGWDVNTFKLLDTSEGRGRRKSVLVGRALVASRPLWRTQVHRLVSGSGNLGPTLSRVNFLKWSWKSFF